MMKILYTPVFEPRQKLHYSFENSIIKVELKYLDEDKHDVGIDTYDFSQLRFGDEIESIETTLPINPIVEIERNNEGVLEVIVLNFIDENATEDEKFPKWVEVDVDGRD